VEVIPVFWNVRKNAEGKVSVNTLAVMLLVGMRDPHAQPIARCGSRSR